MKGFIGFIREQGVMGLAIGFMIGGAISQVVASFVSGIVNPLVGVLFADLDSLADATFKIGSAEILWGDFVVAFVDFVVVAAVVYFLFKGLKLERLDKKREREKEERKEEKVKEKAEKKEKQEEKKG